MTRRDLPDDPTSSTSQMPPQPYRPRQENSLMTTPRRVLTEGDLAAAYRAARTALAHRPRTAVGFRVPVIGVEAIFSAMEATFSAVGILTPPPAPEPGTCTALCPDGEGEWWQCQKEPGHMHAGDEHHAAAGHGWYDGHPDAHHPARSPL